MSHEGIVVIKEPNGLVEDEFLKQALEEYTSCSGAASSDGEMLEVNVNRGPAGLDHINTIQENFLDKRVVFYFGNHPEGFPDDEMQPYSLLVDNGGDDVVLAFIDGDFPGFEKTDTTYSTAYLFAQNKLRQAIHKLWVEAEGDTDKLINLIGAKSFQDEIKNQITRGAIVFMTYDDKVTAVTKTTSVGNFDGFWTSDKLGYEEKPEETVVAPKPEEPRTEPQPLVVERRKSSKLNMGGTSTAAPTAGKTESKPAGEQYIMMRCPAAITKNNKQRQWHEEFHGVCPGNYKSRPEVRVPIAKIQAAAKAGEGWAKALMTSANMPKPFSALEDKINGGADTGTSLPATPPNAKPSTLPIASTEPVGQSSDWLQVPPADAIAKYFKEFAVRNDLKGLVDASGNPVPLDPAVIQEAETKQTSIWEILKTSPMQYCRWPTAAKVIFRSQHPQLSMRVHMWFANQWAIQALTQKAPVADPTTTVTGTPVVTRRKKSG